MVWGPDRRNARPSRNGGWKGEDGTRLQVTSYKSDRSSSCSPRDFLEGEWNRFSPSDDRCSMFQISTMAARQRPSAIALINNKLPIYNEHPSHL